MTLTSIGTSRPICVDCVHSAALLKTPIKLENPISTTKTSIDYGIGPTLALITYPIK